MANHGVAPEGQPTESADAETTDLEETGAEVESTAVEPESDAEPSDADDHEDAPTKPRMSTVRKATILGLVAVVALAALTGWLGFRAYESRKAEEQRNLFIQIGRQGALNLTTIDHQQADADVQRILDSATGTFYDDFQARSQPFVEVVKQAQSKSVGTVTEAGLESESDNGAQVLVAVTVKTSNVGAAEQEPRSWRMRISVERVGDDAKVSNVEFVP